MDQGARFFSILGFAFFVAMHTIYIDADACPVKEETYRVAHRYGVHVVVVANAPLRVPTDSLVELVVRPGFGAADDWIAEQVGQGDIVITADIPLAARCLAKDALVLGPKGRPFTDSDIGSALAVRDLMSELRQAGTVMGGPSPMSPKDRSRFLSKLDEMVNSVRKQFPPSS
ncbi:MAG TPA: YaiI/YqxD family protein [Gemmataceae bacterium]|nr:YaiI/YqxD family protein [Gemmataceae bacterium]